MSTPSLKVVVAITSPIAFHELSNQSVLQSCIQTCNTFISQYGPDAHLSLAGTEEDLLKVIDLDYEKIQCDPNSVRDLVQALKSAKPFELLMIHDSQRALTRTAQFDRTVQALTADFDAARPVSAFTETLKSINSDQFVDGTIDRNSMKRVSSPELIRYNAIDFLGDSSTWFVPLKAAAKTTTVDADAESTRINSEKEIELMKHLLDWNQ